MDTDNAPEGILLVDDGELDEVARVLEAQGLAYRRLRGGQIPAEVAPPRDLLIVTPRRVERVRRGSPADARPGRPLRIIAVGEDSPAMRRRLRRSGLHLLIRLPADPEIWRLLVARALYRGSERREDPRVAVGSPVALGVAAQAEPAAESASSVLLDLSNRGCRLRTRTPIAVGDPLVFTLSEQDEAWPGQGPLALRGTVRRLVVDSESDLRTAAVVFDEDLDEATRTDLAGLINHWASGPRAFEASSDSDAPTIPPCQLASLPDLTLDDETDPPVMGGADVQLRLAGEEEAIEHADARFDERRIQPRAAYSSPIEASSIVSEEQQGPFVLIGRDLSSGGMRIERHPDLALGDQFRLALRGPGCDEAFVVGAEIVRDDGERGFGLVFDPIDSDTAIELEKMVACLPDVESLEDGEMAGLGAVLSEIVEQTERRG